MYPIGKLKDVIAVSRALQKTGDNRSGQLERNDYLMAFALDREMHRLSIELPEWARWKPANIAGANTGFFLFQ